MNGVAFLGIAWLLLIRSIYPDGVPPKEGSPFPKSVSVTMKLPERAEIGESVQGSFVIKNLGPEPITAYGEVDEFLLTAMMTLQVKDARGTILEPDPDRIPFHGGPDIGQKWAKPGESISIPFRLLNHGAIVNPGSYTVTALLSPSGPDAPPARPIFISRISFALPSPRNAGSHIHALCRKTDDESVWKLLELRSPILVPALLAEGKAGHPQACIALRDIVGNEACEALLELAGSRDRKVAKAAALALLYRLPSKFDPKEPAIGIDAGFFYIIKPPPWPDDFRSPDPLRVEVVKQWDVKFDQSLFSVGLKLLDRVEEPYRYPSTASEGLGPALGKLRKQLGQARRTKATDQEYVPVWNKFYQYTDRMEDASIGALIIGARGSSDHAPALLEATDRALRIPMRPRRDLDYETLAPPPMFNLIDSINALFSRGWRTEGQGNAANRLALCLQLAAWWIPKPGEASWHRILHSAIHDPSPVLRQYAVEVIPVPLTEEWEREVRIALRDQDAGVLTSASSVASKSGLKSLDRPLLQIVEGGSDLSTKLAAAEAAEKLGARMELWRAWCGVIPDAKATKWALNALIHGTIDLTFGGLMEEYDSPDVPKVDLSLIQIAWRTFLEKNGALLESGKRVPADDPSIAALLADFHFEIRLEDGRTWPLPK